MPSNAITLVFDSELKNWSHEGEAFAKEQPINVPDVPAQTIRPRWTNGQRRALQAAGSKAAPLLVPIGGDYWRKTNYPIVPEASGPWVSSAYAQGSPNDDHHNKDNPYDRGDRPKGNLWKKFVIDKNYLRVAVGGDNHPDVGVELLIEPPPEGNLPNCGEPPIGPSVLKAPLPVWDFKSYVPVHVWRGANQESVQVTEFPSPNMSRCQIRGLRALIRIFDLSERHHINVGRIEATDTPLDPSLDVTRAPIWGFADFHTHPMSYLALGGMQGVHTIWGVPGGSIHEYIGPTRAAAIARDVPPCNDPTMQYNAHQGGFAAPVMINGTESRVGANFLDLAATQIADVHPSQGAPSFHDFPNHRLGAHQQYHITQIHRAYLGGLRLMTAMAVHNQGLEYGMGWVTCSSRGLPTVDTTADLDVVRAQVQAMRELAALNKDWMQIAYTPEQARKIISGNRLAVVLGVEVDQLGQVDGRSVEAQVKELDDLGIRQVIPVHAMDNMLGGTAVFEDLYNSVNDWLYRGAKHRDEVQEISGLFTSKPFEPSSFYDVTSDVSPLSASETVENAASERILFRLGNPRRIVLSDAFPHPSGGYTYSRTILGDTFSYGVLHPFLNTDPAFKSEQGPYDRLPPGHRNRRGLTGRGREFFMLLMKHGMLVDLAHMSDQTLFDLYALLDQNECQQYPLIVSHAHFRSLPVKVDYSDRADSLKNSTNDIVRGDLLSQPPKFAMRDCVRVLTNLAKMTGRDMCDPMVLERERISNKCDPIVLEKACQSREQSPWAGPGTVNRENLPREYDISSAEVSRVRQGQGAIGVFLAQGPMDESAFRSQDNLPSELEKKLPFDNDCAGSSKDFAAAMLFAQARMKDGGAIGIASDFIVTGSVWPRFGDDACGTYLDTSSGSDGAAQLLEALMDKGQYQIDDQRFPVMYSTGVSTCARDRRDTQKIGDVNCGASNEPLDPYVMGERTYDFNVDGLAHYGLVPDMLQDTANVLRDKNDVVMAPLFNSAEGYVQMWERARALAGCGSVGSLCSHPPVKEDHAACGGACPTSWNHGAPLQSLEDTYGTCAVGKEILVPIADANGKIVNAGRSAIYYQRRANPRERGDLTQQGDWAIFPIRTNPTWQCGEDEQPQPLKCPSGANYVKVRRILDTTVGRLWEANCNWQPLPPEVGNRRVVFQCLAGPSQETLKGQRQ